MIRPATYYPVYRHRLAANDKTNFTIGYSGWIITCYSVFRQYSYAPFPAGISEEWYQ